MDYDDEIKDINLKDLFYGFSVGNYYGEIGKVTNENKMTKLNFQTFGYKEIKYNNEIDFSYTIREIKEHRKYIYIMWIYDLLLLLLIVSFIYKLKKLLVRKV